MGSENRKKAARAQQQGDLLSIELVIFGFAAVNGLHIQGVAEHEGDLFTLTKVGQPVPAEDALTGHHETVSVGGDGFEESFGSCSYILV